SSSSTRTSKIPPVPGTSATSPTSPANVARSSCAIHAARSIHLHCVQYSIWILGDFGILRHEPAAVDVDGLPRQIAIARDHNGNRGYLFDSTEPAHGNAIR